MSTLLRRPVLRGPGRRGDGAPAEGGARRHRHHLRGGLRHRAVRGGAARRRAAPRRVGGRGPHLGLPQSCRRPGRCARRGPGGRAWTHRRGGERAGGAAALRASLGAQGALLDGLRPDLLPPSVEVRAPGIALGEARALAARLRARAGRARRSTTATPGWSGWSARRARAVGRDRALRRPRARLHGARREHAPPGRLRAARRDRDHAARRRDRPLRRDAVPPRGPPARARRRGSSPRGRSSRWPRWRCPTWLPPGSPWPAPKLPPAALVAPSWAEARRSGSSPAPSRWAGSSG